MTTPDGNRTARGWLAFLAALLLLNASLSFENVWPTPAIWWRGRLSIELALSLLLLALAHRAVNRSPAKWLRWLAVIWLLLVFGRYGDVTAPALYGRDINLYWDARFMPDVAAMVVRVVPRRRILAKRRSSWFRPFPYMVLGSMRLTVALAALLESGRPSDGAITAFDAAQSASIIAPGRY